MNPQQLLEKLGYHPHEVKIYLAALELGEGTVSELAHHAGMSRTTVSELLEHMQKRGLLVSYLKKTHKYWIPQNPEKLLDNLRSTEKAFEGLLPELVAMRRGSGNKPIVNIFLGVEDIKRIMSDLIESKHHISGLVSMDDWFEFFGEDFTRDFIKQRASHFLKMRMISPKTANALRLKKLDSQELRHIRFLPPEINLRRITNFIYGDKITIISFNKKEPTGIIIDDSDIAYGNMLYFENLWQHSSES